MDSKTQELTNQIEQLKLDITTIKEKLNSVGLDVKDWNHFQLKRPIDNYTSNIVEDVIKDLRNNKRTQVTATSTAVTPDSETEDMLVVTALASALTINAPRGNPTNTQIYIMRIKDNGGARALTFNSIYRGGVSLVIPTTTTISKNMYLGFMYNVNDTKWDLLAYEDGY